MKAVHFGAGNIGRGFIGALLHQAGYEVVFIDVNKAVIDELNKRNAYKVQIAEQNGAIHTITNVRGINSQENEQDVVNEIATADLVTTAVGPAILKFVAAPIAKGIKQRIAAKKVLNVIACENAIGATSILKEHIQALMTEKEWPQVEEMIGFPNAAVDRIVPNQENEDILAVSVEPFYEWVVDQSAIKGPTPQIDGITYVKDLIPYIERKLFTVNTGHAMAAYLGFVKGVMTIKEAMDHEEIASLVEEALHETKKLLVKKYEFTEVEQEAYIQKILLRYKNEYLSDRVERVGRNPIRKLGYNDRLIKPARQLLELGVEPQALIHGIVAALSFHVPEDEESVRIQHLLQEKGLRDTLEEITGLKPGEALFERITQVSQQGM
ncbi:mannitol-1-phosphate 5-dehydrogenase [Halalkalibacterium ligniniphilum]|uniref:mannitol-1-phosphate 5-dehydrogenase n=1 Tax=Halalkalibacterium ligniniphilum TaxID=1134413 RepID=UPI0003459737|nr:mannitol-1-phosphate 5-dehydrogenase [Halalkalibacterium ligniniphilum]